MPITSSSMLTKEERKAYNTEFWEDFRKFMRPYASESGKRVNWLNYPTNIRYIYVRLDANNKFAAFNFDIQPKDDGIRAIIWEQMEELKVVLTASMNDENGEWLKDEYQSSTGYFSRIQWKLEDVNYFNPEDKEKIFSFFKNKLLGFDDFYSNFSEILILLAK